MEQSVIEAKAALDRLIRGTRSDFYKPIQIAEVLYRDRVSGDVICSDPRTYHRQSRAWRDQVTRRLSGKVSTSSDRFQNDIWRAISERNLEALGNANKRGLGVVENYIYLRYAANQESIVKMVAYVRNTPAGHFDINHFFEQFDESPSLRRNADRAYELLAHSLFVTLLEASQADVAIFVPDEFRNRSPLSQTMLRALGLSSQSSVSKVSPSVFRGGKTNAADGGIDMWANYGPAFQVKHVSLTSAILENLLTQVESPTLVVVCREVAAGARERIRAVVELARESGRIVEVIDALLIRDLVNDVMTGGLAEHGDAMLLRLRTGLELEFSQAASLVPFFDERGYVWSLNDGIWVVGNDGGIA